MNNVQRVFYHEKMLEFPFYAFYHDQNELSHHWHDFIELVYVKRGHGLHCHEDQAYPIHGGDCFVINTGELHGYKKNADLKIVNILFTQEFLKPLSPVLSSVGGFADFFSLEPLFRKETSFRYKLHLASDQRLHVETLIDRLIHELDTRKNGFEAMSTGLFIEIITILSRAFSDQNSTAMRSDLSGKGEAVGQAISYLESAFDKEVSLQDVASSVCLSVSRLSHVFKTATGMSLMDYLLRYRLDRAKELLRVDKKRTITDVAFSVGFHDPGYFSRAFKKYFGHSPRQTVKI